MTRVTFEISDELAKKADGYGLLNSKTIEELLDRKARTCAVVDRSKFAGESIQDESQHSEQVPVSDMLPNSCGEQKPLSLKPEVIDEIIANAIASCPDLTEEEAREFENEAREFFNDAFEREPKPRTLMEISDRLFRCGDGISIDLILPLEGDEDPSIIA